MEKDNNPLSAPLGAQECSLLDLDGQISDPTLFFSLNKHNYSLDFNPYVGLGYDFIKKIGEVTSKQMDIYAEGQSYPSPWGSVRKFWIWVSINIADMFPDVAAKMKFNIKLTEKEWQLVVNSFRSALTAPSHLNTITSGSDPSKNSFIWYLRPFLNHYAEQNVLPKVTLLSIRKASKKSRPKKSLAEISRNGVLAEDVKILIDQVLNEKSTIESIDKKQKEDFIKALYSDGNNTESKKDILTELIELNNVRLRDLRYVMEKTLLNEYDKYKLGKKLLYECDLSYAENLLPAIEDYIKIGTTNIPTMLNTYFTASVDDKTALGRLLKLINERWCGIVPNTSQKHKWDLRSFYISVLKNRKISTSEIIKLVGLSDEAMIAAYTIILIDTGKNASDISNLKNDCLVKTDDIDLFELISNKKRSGNKVTPCFLKVNDGNKVSSIKAIEIVKEMTQQYRNAIALNYNTDYNTPIVKNFKYKISDKLFICRPAKMSPTYMLTCGVNSGCITILRKICERYETVKGIPFTFDSIRPSVHLKRYFEGNLDADIAQSNLSHRDKSKTSGYVIKYPSKLALEREIRRFQNEFEAVMIANIPNAAFELGYTPEEFEKLLNSAMRNGLGCVCLQSIMRKQNMSANIIKDCNFIEDCNKCSSMRIVVTSKDNLVDAILFDDYMEENHEEMMAINNDRFVNIWLPNWARVKATIEKAKITPSVNSAILLEANTIAKTIGASAIPFMF